MTFYSFAFLLFFALFSIAVHFSSSSKIQRYVFLIANIVFYAYWDYRFLLLLFLIIMLCYGSAVLFEKFDNKWVIYLSIASCIAVLGIFKYFDFFAVSFAKMFGIKDYVTLNLILPLGISFYIFQAMSYLFDVLRGAVKVEKDFIKVAVYISFFTQITAGPIVKARDFLPQLEDLHKIKKENIYEGLQLFLVGLTKKVVFADRIGVAVDVVFRAPAAYNFISIALAIIGYTFQIYCDFSGYSNMAIGIAKVWDFDLGENFNAPYIAQNPSDFWRRWHISLSTWFRDYVYIPLGGSRKGKKRTWFNLFFTMVLSGIWHGANYTFILWGMVHGVGSVAHKIYKDLLGEKKIGIIIPKALSISLTFIFVALAWVIFRAESIAEALVMYKGLFNLNGILFINVYVVVYVALLELFNLYSMKKNSNNVIAFNLNLDKLKNKLIIAVWIWMIVLFMYCGNSAFIYAQF